MTQNVPQWLAEIKTLQQQLAETQQDRNEANASADNWRRLYETEAQQRRTETYLAQQTIESLKAEVERLRDLPQLEQGAASAPSVAQSEIEQLQTVAELKTKLIEVLVERDQLAQALKAEKTNHAQTRKSLTTALGDAVDLLTKERSAQGEQGFDHSLPEL